MWCVVTCCASVSNNSGVMPVHVGIIMDGNGRWATKRKLPRLAGHKQGLKVAENIIDYCNNIGIKFLSLYVFSTENWKRPKAEVDGLFALAKNYLDNTVKASEGNVKVVVSGDILALPLPLRNKISKTVCLTQNNTGICVNLCINYGGQTEIVDAVNKLVSSGSAITKENLEGALYNALPPVDVIVRTGGEKRLSNFLLYQSAYAELFFTDTLWPDFTEKHLQNILDEYFLRTRKFGAVAE